MLFNAHSELEGKHAFLSPSNYHWMNYTEEKLDRRYEMSLAAARGTRHHDLAATLIREKINLPRNNKTLNRYVNDCIGFRMTPEQPLFYSVNCFGHADAVGFRANRLRIFDLKTGAIPGNVKQLLGYAALFCLEYKFKPTEIDIELRLYQNNDIEMFEGDPDDVTHVMSTIVNFDKRINAIKMEVMS